MGGLVRRLENPRRILYGHIPGFPHSSVMGHEGVLIVGTLAGREVLVDAQAGGALLAVHKHAISHCRLLKPKA